MWHILCYLYRKKDEKNNKGGLIMKRLTTILGITMLVGPLSIPVFVWANGWGYGHHMGGPHMMGYSQHMGGYGKGSCWH